MWYLGGKSYINPPWHVGLAVSTDGITWTKYNDPTTMNHPYAESDPVLSPSPGEWDGDFVEASKVMLIDDTLHMWYDGWKDPAPPNLSYIGHATMPLERLLDPDGIEDYGNSHIANGYSLSQNYPNPFNPSTTIEFTIPKSEFVELKIYNILGKEISTTVSEKLNPGKHTYTFSVRNLASGVYYYRLEAGNFVKTRKMIYLK